MKSLKQGCRAFGRGFRRHAALLTVAAGSVMAGAGAYASGGSSVPDGSEIITKAQTTYESVVPIVLAVVGLGVVISYVALLKRK